MGMLRPAMVVLRRWCGGFECAYFADCLRHVAVGSAITAQLGSFRSNWRVARTGGWSFAVGDCGDALLPVALQSFGVAIPLAKSRQDFSVPSIVTCYSCRIG